MIPVAAGTHLYIIKKCAISSLFGDTEHVFHFVEMQYDTSI